jgi:hypothetical protein
MKTPLTLERIMEILHPFIVPLLDHESIGNMRACSRKLKEIMGYYVVEPEELLNGKELVSLCKYDFYKNRWIQFWRIPDEFSEVYTSGKQLLYVLGWHEDRYDRNNPTMLATGIAKWENEVPIPAPFEFSDIRPYKRLEWGVKTFYVDLEKAIAFYGSNSWNEPSIYRLHSDYEYDGAGYENSLVSIPVWTKMELGVPFHIRKEILKHFLAIDRYLKDIQESQIVHDIIDPNLNPRYFPDNSHSAVVQRMKDRLVGPTMDRITYVNHREHGLGWRQGPFCNHLNSIRIPIREHYHWVPSDISIHANGKVEFLSPIHSVEERFQAKTQRICAYILERMMPLLEKGDIVTKGIPANLQVIVKVQRYELPPYSSYEGKWHVEGLTENILYGSVYYIDQDPSLTGGGLKFRNSGTHERSFYHPATQRDIVANVFSDTAIVFANIVPHRLLKLVNDTNQPASRTFINFFVIDPKKPLVSTANYVSQMGLEEAKALRTKHREEMSIPDFKFGFARVNWGNSGTLEFLDHTTRTMCREYEHCEIDSRSSDSDY